MLRQVDVPGQPTSELGSALRASAWVLGGRSRVAGVNCGIYILTHTYIYIYVYMYAYRHIYTYAHTSP